MKKKSVAPIDLAAVALREIALQAAEGTFLGSEDELIAKLAVSRPTVRQAARLLEREGVLLVRRGINGGYFAARPTSEMVEMVVCAYLDTLGLDARHTGAVANALWAEALREAATADQHSVRTLADRFSQEVEQLAADAPLEEISRVERRSREAIFELIGGRYIDLIFRINVAFARQHIDLTAPRPKGAEHRSFVTRWKKAKIIEFEAIAAGDEMLAMMAALHTRRLWMGRVRGGAVIEPA